MESWVIAAISVLIGILMVAISMKQDEFSLALAIMGIIIMVFGLLVFVFKFKKWVEQCQTINS